MFLVQELALWIFERQAKRLDDSTNIGFNGLNALIGGGS